MNKKDLAIRAADLLRENNVRKPVKIKKHVFTVTDSDGNSANFAVKRGDKEVLYTVDDAINILDACLEAAKEALRHGDEIAIKGFGILKVHRREARAVKRPDTGEWCEAPARYVPKFQFGNELRMAAKVYELSLSDAEAAKKLHELEEQHDDELDLEW